MYLIDTNVAIHLRDGDRSIIAKLDALPARPVMSILTVIEMEGGIVAEPEHAIRRRAGLDRLTSSIVVLDFDAQAVAPYRAILETRGFVRSRIVDRMIAATAIAHDLTLITINGSDFRDIPGLKLEIWPSPAAQ